MKADKIRLDKVIGRNIKNKRKCRKITRDELAETIVQDGFAKQRVFLVK